MAGTHGAAQPACDVYWASLAALPPDAASLLDADEIARARRYARARDRSRFVLGAVLLRLVLAERTGGSPAGVRVDRTCSRCGEQHGRPLAPGTGLHVSVAHSGEYAAVATTTAGPVGVDVEAVRPIDRSALSREICTPEERRSLTDDEAFFTYWTRKESIVKATGAGLTTPLADVVVTPPGEAPRLLRYGEESPPSARMADVSPAPGYAGAVAVLTRSAVTFRAAAADALVEGGVSRARLPSHAAR